MLTRFRIPRPPFFVTGAGLILTLALVSGASAPPKSSARTDGKQVYRQQCASCHGANGEGGSGYSAPLTGNRSVTELASYIAKSMPPGPKHASPADAKKVAAFIHEAFYSPVAQARIRPARVTLSRLTVRQFRNAVADLVGSYPTALPEERKHGLNGSYHKDRHFNEKERVFTRTDATVNFDFGTVGPDPTKFEPYQFSIVWSGSVLAPDTGEYEFVIRTEHATRLWFNGENKPLIDAWVKSGNDNEYRGSVFLIGGRTYPLYLEFSKGTIGVDDSDKAKGKPAPKASMVFLWKRPGQALEVVPERCLFASGVQETFVVTTPFPPDDRSTGYERGSAVSKAWDEATTAAALETAQYVSRHLERLSGVKNDAPDRREKLKAFCRQFVERAFRRPLTPDVERFYIDRVFVQSPDPEVAVRRIVLLTLKSPRFLYREVDGLTNDPYNIASRLSFGLWDTLPDPALLQAAASGNLTTREQAQQQAQRLAADPRAWNKLREFLLAWLKVDAVSDLAKSQKLYPDFDPVVASDLRTSLELFLENTAGTENADYRALMLSPTHYMNGRLAKLYGVDLPADAPFQPVAFDPVERSGLLTHPYLLSRFAYLDTSSPIHRGVLVARSLLGRMLQPPPEAFAPLSPSLHPNMTTRQRVALQTKPAACSSCHNLINPLGFTLEQYDAIGRLRTVENGQKVDATGSYQTADGKQVKFNGARDLARYLADSNEAKRAFTEKLFLYLVKQPVLAYGPDTLPDLERSFGKNEYNIRKLMIEIMVTSAFPRPEKTGTPTHVAGVQ